jgi:hypothetical protein
MRAIETIKMTAADARKTPPRLTMAALMDKAGRMKITGRTVTAVNWPEFQNSIEAGDTLFFRKTGYKEPFEATAKCEIIADEYSQPAAPAAMVAQPAGPALAGAVELEPVRSLREAVKDKTDLNAANLRVELAAANFERFENTLRRIEEKVNEQAARITALEAAIENLDNYVEELAGEIEESATSEDEATAAALQGATNPAGVLTSALGAALPDLLNLGKEWIATQKTKAEAEQLRQLMQMGYKPTGNEQQQPSAGPMNQGY